MLKLIVFDFDGVFTNGQIYYLPSGECFKSYNVRDGMGINLLKKTGYTLMLISSHNSQSTRAIAEHLGFHHIFIGVSNKYHHLRSFLKIENISHEEIAYIGDDLVDLEPMKLAQFSACPADAVSEIRAIAKYQCQSRGGEGAVREFCDYILTNKL